MVTRLHYTIDKSVNEVSFCKNFRSRTRINIVIMLNTSVYYNLSMPLLHVFRPYHEKDSCPHDFNRETFYTCKIIQPCYV